MTRFRAASAKDKLFDEAFPMAGKTRTGARGGINTTLPDGAAKRAIS